MQARQRLAFAIPVECWLTHAILEAERLHALQVRCRKAINDV